MRMLLLIGLLVTAPACARWKLVTTNAATGSRWSVDFASFQLGRDGQDVRHRWVEVDVKVEHKAGQVEEYRVRFGGENITSRIVKFLKPGTGREFIPAEVLHAAMKIIPEYTASYDSIPSRPRWTPVAGTTWVDYDASSVKRLQPKGYELWIRARSGEGENYQETITRMRIGTNPRQVEVIEPVPRRDVIAYDPQWPWDRMVRLLDQRFRH